MKKITDLDKQYIRRSFELARKGTGCVAPNPLVGAVIVKNDRIIAEGYHHKYGKDHAERNAILKLAKRGKIKDCAKGASIYISLEPCSHFGKTPPCTDIIIESGIKKVYFSIRDPHPYVKQKDSVKKLERAGIKVFYNILAEEGRELNKVFLKNIKEQRPYFILKAAMSLDGKIATKTGESKWITSEKSRKFVHELRYSVDAVLVGINTVLSDNPTLNARLSKRKRKPYKLILGSRTKLPPETKLLHDDKAIFFEHIEDLLVFARNLFHEYHISSVLVEGGGTVNDALIRAGLIDEVFWFIAPKIIGGKNAVSVVDGEGIDALANAPKLKIRSIQEIEQDILINGLF